MCSFSSISFKYMEYLNIIFKAVLCSVIFCVLSCTNKEKSKTPASSIEHIEVAKAIESSKPINASVLGIESFEYVTLETNENTFKLANPYMISTIGDDKLFVKYNKQMALFSQQTGEYILDIGKFGTAPDSYGLVSKSINDRSNLGLVSVLSRNWKEIFEYNISTGEIVNRINIRDVIVDNDTLLSPTSSLLFDFFIQDDENIFCFLPNVFGDSPFRIIRFNDKGILKKAYPQGQTLEERSNRDNSYAEAIFYEYNRQVIFKERYSDTLFVVNDENLSPRFVFDLEEKSPPYQDRYKHSFPNEASYLKVNPPYPYVDRTGYIFIESLIENDNFLIFSTIYKEELSYGFFDKRKGTTHVSKLRNDATHGFYNNIDDFIPFRPSYLDRENNKLVGFVTAEDVLTWFDKNPELASKLPSELSALSRIKPEDNPIVMIGKLKSH
ncbi:MAG: hypothetical protein COW40_03700 [Cytophagales bacterium CG17_big_fil_post_rev_8_21_14_2_50_40_13]|nr:MAG: hypothetical protein COW40_03700 [Cytophagales bacterium CG17_big_fil_post_rev_8_21_14_2_50_40_13]